LSAIGRGQMTTREYALDPERMAGELRTELQSGLSDEEARARLAGYGANALPKPRRLSSLALLASQLTRLIVWGQIGAALVSGRLRVWVDAAAVSYYLPC
jgi:P-type Ca2+ transporter type 2C